MSDNKGFHFAEVKPLGKLSRQELFLVLLHAGSSPPHIAICYGHYYYSLTVKGSEIQLPLTNLLRLVQVRNIPTLLIRLNLAGLRIHHELVSSVFSAYPALQPGGSCLQPVTELIEKIWDITPRAPLVFGLLELLQEHGLLGDCFQLNMETQLEPGGGYLLKYYSPEDVAKRISGLKANL